MTLRVFAARAAPFCASSPGETRPHPGLSISAPLRCASKTLLLVLHTVARAALSRALSAEDPDRRAACARATSARRATSIIAQHPDGVATVVLSSLSALRPHRPLIPRRSFSLGHLAASCAHPATPAAARLDMQLTNAATNYGLLMLARCVVQGRPGVLRGPSRSCTLHRIFRPTCANPSRAPFTIAIILCP